MLSLGKRFLNNRIQRVVLNGLYSGGSIIKAGVPQGSVLGPLFFLICINDLADRLKFKAKLFADDTSLVSVKHDINKSFNNLIQDLNKISNWAFQWKMSFNPGISKKAEEVTFLRKRESTLHNNVAFNHYPIEQSLSQKHFGLFFDKKLSFGDHIDSKIKKVNLGINVLSKHFHFIPRHTLVRIY